MMNKLAKPARKQSKVHRSLLLGSFSALGLLAVSTVTAGAKAVNVGTGDTVWGIAQREGLSTTKIEQANPSINRVSNSIDLIFAGQQLQLPTAANLNQSLSQQGLYTVQKGDTLSRIAKRFHVTVAQLKTWNHLNNDLIYVGQQLAVNADAAESVTPAVDTQVAPTEEVAVPTENATVAVQPETTVSEQPAASQAPVSAATASEAAASSEAPVQSVAPAQSQSTASSDAPAASSAATSDVAASSAAQSLTSDSTVASASQDAQSQEVAQQPAAADENAEPAAQSASAATSTASAAPAQSVAASSAQNTQTLNVQASQTNNAANWSQLFGTSFVEVPAQSATQTVQTSQTASAATQTAQVSQTASVASQSAQVNQTASTANTQSAQAPVSQSAQSTAAQPSQAQSQQTSQATSQSTSAASNSSDLQSGSVVSLAVKLANSNIPYVWGGNSLSGMDCSGLVDYVYAHATGKQLPHYTVSLESCVNQHPVSQAQAGDLLFWGQHGATYHTAIYIGNNQYVAAPQPGENVQIQSISQYFMPSFAGTVK
ncbi:LysM peptidoglycan-binding domain-containing protein [Limosilactobacillus sp.]|uniref:C40 family peptidase n=1 Tax=Limosilactobacillus sp. TaxID=2773925 RepID=UPI00345EB3D9